MRELLRLPATCLLLFALAAPALAQEDIPFAGGTLSIEETPDYEKVISFDDQEIARDYMAFFDRIADIGGTEVAMFSIGPGGNACGANTLMVWMDEADNLKTDKLPGDCGWPSAAVSDYEIVFMPWVGPGEELPVRNWTPETGFTMAGILRFAPEPGTGWADLAEDPATYPLHYFYNEAFFAMAAPVLGDDLERYATGLRVSSEMENTGDGIYAGTGCEPHNCGGADSLLVVDINAKKAWFAQIRDNTVAQWPEPAEWPAEARDALRMLGN